MVSLESVATTDPAVAPARAMITAVPFSNTVVVLVVAICACALSRRMARHALKALRKP